MRPNLRVIPGGEGNDDDETPSTSSLPPAHSGDKPDIGALFEAHASYVGAVALRLLGRRDEVDDVVQEVFIAAHKGLRHADEPRAVRRWLAKVAVRTARRRLRSLRAKGFLGMGDSPDYDALADRDATAEQRALVARVYDVLDHMPPKNRLAWVLRHVEGHRLEEVAELCDCSLATAKRRIAAARDTLKDAFES